jgi:phosphoribosylformylglycinamidine synthase
MVAAPNLASKSWVTNQYDRYVLGDTVLAQPEDSGVIRVATSGKGVAVSTDGNGRWCQLDPYQGAQLVVAEAYRNVATTGAKPLAVTNCLNFGSPEDSDVMWQFVETVRGLADACEALGVPVTGGNVSFYNQTGDTPIQPTPVIGVLGVIDNVERRTSMALDADGESILLVGETRDEFGGSEWAHEIHQHLGGLPPTVDLAHERRLAEILVAASRDRLVSAAHDVSVGGLAQTLVEMALRGDRGARIVLPEALEPFVAMFSESAGRVVVVVPRSAEARFSDLCASRQVSLERIGVVDRAASTLDFQGLFPVSLDELRTASESTLPALFG